ncbi:MAG: DUF4349 domain-containing protein [Gemmatimonadaceae bacterium]
MKARLLLVVALFVAVACNSPRGADGGGSTVLMDTMAFAEKNAAGEGVSPEQSPVSAPEVDLSRATNQTSQPGPQRPVSDTGTIAPSMIIRTGQVSIEVDSLAQGIARVRDLATRVGGYVANSSVQAGGEEPKSATLEIKLPAARFDEAISGLSRIGKVESQVVSAEDVSEEFVDVSARVANAKRLEARLVELLANRTGRLSDVLQVERELARVREEIERYEGRMRYLRTRSAVSTLSITIHEPRPVVGERGSTNVLAEAFRNAWRNFVGFVAGLISSLGILVPVAAIVVVLALILRRFLPPRKPGNQSK